MSDQRHELIENLDKYLIGIDDVFAFKCRECGKCCRRREDILLNSRDVYNIATALDMTHEQVIETYCTVYIGQESRIPIVRLLPKDRNRNCPLLQGDRCIIHVKNPALKPTVCAAFPVGRVVASEHAPEDMGLGMPYEIQYILTDTRCGSRKRKQTVRAWLEKFHILIDDQFFIEWNKALIKIVSTVQLYDGKKGVTDKSMDMLWSAIFQSIYLDYDTSKDFFPQFEANIAKLTGVFDKQGKMF
jgi:Fe-S-cluster containining protein